MEAAALPNPVTVSAPKSPCQTKEEHDFSNTDEQSDGGFHVNLFFVIVKCVSSLFDYDPNHQDKEGQC